MAYVLGLDLGTSSLKGLLADRSGKIIATESADYPLTSAYPGYSEQEPADWIEATRKVLAALAVTVPDFKEELAGISFSGQMHSLVLLDRQNKVLRPAILWNDVRTTEECQLIMEQAGKHVLEKTKNRALEGFTLPKLLWVKKNEPTIWRQVEHFLLPKDYLGYWLTGNLQMEYSDAAGTLLLDVARKNWDQELAEIFELPQKIFPKLIASADEIGTVRSELAEELGLSDQIRVFAGGADNACAALGAGIISEDIGMVSIGTSGVFLAFEGNEERNYQGKVHYFNHVIPDSYYSMGVTLAAGHSLNWFKQDFGAEESFEVFLDGIENIPVGSDGLLFTPYIMGERTPYVDSQIRGCFIGLDSHHQRPHFIRSVLEGITFSLKDTQVIMAETTQKQMKKIISVGGGAKNKTWLQMQADIFDAEIITLKTEQGPGLGAMMLAALGCGWFDSIEECVAKFVEYGDRHLPDPKNVATYQQYYNIYKKIYSQTKDITHKLQALAQS